MKNKFAIRAIAVAVYFLVGVLWFFIIKDEISANYRHLGAVTGLIGAAYFIPFSLIKSLREESPIKRYLIVSDIIFYLAFAYMILIALADSPLLKIVGIVVMFMNLLFCVISYFKSEKNEKMIQRLIGLHILLAFVMPMISY